MLESIFPEEVCVYATTLYSYNRTTMKPTFQNMLCRQLKLNFDTFALFGHPRLSGSPKAVR